MDPPISVEELDAACNPFVDKLTPSGPRPDPTNTTQWSIDTTAADRYVVALEKTLSHFRSRLETRLAAARRARNRLHSPLAKLPEELVCVMFRHYLDETEGREYWNRLYNIGQVCWSFWQTLNSSNSFWTTISYKLPSEMVELCLTRSGEAPLCIIDQSHRTAGCTTPAVLQHCHRIRTLSLIYSHDEFVPEAEAEENEMRQSEIRDSLDWPAPLLEELSLSSSIWSPFLQVGTLFQGYTPRLSSVKLHRVSFAQAAFAFKCLARLELLSLEIPSEQALFELLKQSPALMDLTLAQISFKLPRASGSGDCKLTPVTLPQLLSLSISDDHIRGLLTSLREIHTPAVRHFNLQVCIVDPDFDDSSDSDTEEDQDAREVQIVRAIEHYGATIRKIISTCRRIRLAVSSRITLVTESENGEVEDGSVAVSLPSRPLQMSWALCLYSGWSDCPQDSSRHLVFGAWTPFPLFTSSDWLKSLQNTDTTSMVLHNHENIAAFLQHFGETYQAGNMRCWPMARLQQLAIAVKRSDLSTLLEGLRRRYYPAAYTEEAGRLLPPAPLTKLEVEVVEEPVDEETSSTVLAALKKLFDSGVVIVAEQLSDSRDELVCDSGDAVSVGTSSTQDYVFAGGA